jgi:hypothetical protein
MVAGTAVQLEAQGLWKQDEMQMLRCHPTIPKDTKR